MVGGDCTFKIDIVSVRTATLEQEQQYLGSLSVHSEDLFCAEMPDWIAVDHGEHGHANDDFNLLEFHVGPSPNVERPHRPPCGDPSAIASSLISKQRFLYAA